MGIPANQRGPFRPMRFEATIEDCIVSGELPDGLEGGFYRNGPTWRRPNKQGLETVYTIDGMVQGLVFRDGKVEFRNRWVRTPKFVAEERAGRSLFSYADGKFDDWRAWGLGDAIRDEHNAGIPQGVANINAMPFNGEVLALSEQGCPPIALDPITLETKGIVPWSSQLSDGLFEKVCFGDGAFGPHPKWDEVKEELWSCTYRDRKPFISVHCVTLDGVVRTKHLDDGPYCAIAHDMWITENYAIVAFAPFLQDRARIAQGRGLYGWDVNLPTVIAVIRRDDIDGPVQWIEADFEPEYIMHTLSANETDGKIVLDGPIFNSPPFKTDEVFPPGGPFVPFWQVGTTCIGRWVLDLEKGKATSEHLSDIPAELPKIDERFWGKPYEWGFYIAGEQVNDGMRMNTVLRRNVHTGKEDSYTIKHDRPIGVYESVFVPRSPDAPEGDGYLITPVSYFNERHTDFMIFNAEDLPAGPIAKVELPFAVGWTPHGHWMDFH
ncbi:carotenoid oxygenase family protein [[Mycobacterium] burgundiense]|uniref:Dioxygenase n=1 Tax=[Mycobacterium] burgundiense TaxID=3064286 RepID=A0ABZ3JDD9_9MYCO|nr:carotenoid oxygenase family protein [Mycolicibacterium sp. MU0053]CAJ1511074.1 carotenoid oxygenase family protein [Mycolicibacterium sp. MU0053]